MTILTVGAAVVGGNGAGIRFQAGNLAITNSWFHNNQDGILGGTGTGIIAVTRLPPFRKARKYRVKAPEPALKKT